MTLFIGCGFYSQLDPRFHALQRSSTDRAPMTKSVAAIGGASGSRHVLNFRSGHANRGSTMWTGAADEALMEDGEVGRSHGAGRLWRQLTRQMMLTVLLVVFAVGPIRAGRRWWALVTHVPASGALEPDALDTRWLSSVTADSARAHPEEDVSLGASSTTVQTESLQREEPSAASLAGNVPCRTGSSAAAVCARATCAHARHCQSDGACAAHRAVLLGRFVADNRQRIRGVVREFAATHLGHALVDGQVGTVYSTGAPMAGTHFGDSVRARPTYGNSGAVAGAAARRAAPHRCASAAEWSVCARRQPLPVQRGAQLGAGQCAHAVRADAGRGLSAQRQRVAGVYHAHGAQPVARPDATGPRPSGRAGVRSAARPRHPSGGTAARQTRTDRRCGLWHGCAVPRAGVLVGPRPDRLQTLVGARHARQRRPDHLGVLPGGLCGRFRAVSHRLHTRLAALRRPLCGLRVEQAELREGALHGRLPLLRHAGELPPPHQSPVHAAAQPAKAREPPQRRLEQMALRRATATTVRRAAVEAVSRVERGLRGC
eukprot:ctg_63.g9